MSQKYQDPFVTVVSVGNEDKSQQCTPKKAMTNSEYITVLTIGNEETKTIKDVTEEVIVYRLPGERLGFGLKFEGGTKAYELVKRLFIQSCASDSPASRVQSSWGQLVEGDEVLEIDSIPVNSMTRIDCVRFLKDSNVAIKLLIKHSFNTTPSVKQKSKSSEDLPVIISTEEKKPPPVPPRKLHRKLHKNLQNNNENTHDSIVPTIKQQESFFSKSTRLQSPRNSFRKKFSPDVARRLSDGSLGPPDAEVYLDLISQESTQSLSESDDTGSTISTVLDRFASFPTTTTSSFAGSLPSTPTSIQRHLDLSYIINDFPEDDFLPMLEKNLCKSNMVEENNNIVSGIEEDNVKCLQELQQTHLTDQIDFAQLEKESSPKTPKRPVIIPRSKDKINRKSSEEDKENTLPRLVDFVPKSPQKDIDVSIDTLKRFLESEKFDFEYIENENHEANDIDYTLDPYSSKWILSSHLSTIGEDEEEQSGQEFLNNFGSSCCAPRVTIEGADLSKNETILFDNTFSNTEVLKDKQAPMESPPSDSRQPPDGHEFPDFVETTLKVTHYTDAQYEPGPIECPTKFNSSWDDMDQPKITSLDRSISSSNCDLRPKINDSDDEKYETFSTSNLLHSRSQSLIDMSIFSKEKKSSKWNTLAEQRKKRLSKLKGLVIPEALENEVTPLVNIPEIKSITTSQIDLAPKPEANQNGLIRSSNNTVAPLVLPSWAPNPSLPKYSPAFKRKSLQVYPVNTVKRSDSDAESSYDEYISKYSDGISTRITDDPKSLESIASPTRSDCSFEYSNSKTISIRDHHLSKDFGDSDNDSAVSSSQSSYNSRSSPPPSPNSDDKSNRLLKPFSVEAINRKNILASAKCRSGKDIKIGSPVIQRKTSLEEEITEESKVDEAVAPNYEIPEEVNQAQLQEKQIMDNESTADAVVPKEVYISQSSVLVNQPVILEVHVPHVEQTCDRAVGVKVDDKVVEKPIPTKRSIPPIAVQTKDNKTDMGENRLSSLLGRHSAANFLEKRNKPVNIQSLRANFENSNNSMPVFPKSYKAENRVSPVRTPPELANGGPIVTTRRRSEESIITSRRKSDEKLLFRQISHDETIKTEPRRLSNSITTKEEPKRNPKTPTKKEETVVNSQTSDNREAILDSTELRTVDLSLDTAGGSLGITLAGGADYENKNITIHRIRYGSVAYQDGRLKKGDKIISINGLQTTGLTHSEATELLKKPYTKFTIVTEESRDYVPSSNLSKKSSSSVTSLSSDSKALEVNSAALEAKKPTNTVTLIKDGAGLGFSIEGGKDSPKGDVPLVIKKIFTGGAADKCGDLKVGDQILSVNKINFQNLSRIEAWSQMKKIPEGTVMIEIFR